MSVAFLCYASVTFFSLSLSPTDTLSLFPSPAVLCLTQGDPSVSVLSQLHCLPRPLSASDPAALFPLLLLQQPQRDRKSFFQLFPFRGHDKCIHFSLFSASVCGCMSVSVCVSVCVCDCVLVGFWGKQATGGNELLPPVKVQTCHTSLRKAPPSSSLLPYPHTHTHSRTHTQRVLYVIFAFNVGTCTKIAYLSWRRDDNNAPQ